MKNLNTLNKRANRMAAGLQDRWHGAVDSLSTHPISLCPEKWMGAVRN